MVTATMSQPQSNVAADTKFFLTEPKPVTVKPTDTHARKVQTGKSVKCIEHHDIQVMTDASLDPPDERRFGISAGLQAEYGEGAGHDPDLCSCYNTVIQINVITVIIYK